MPIGKKEGQFSLRNGKRRKRKRQMGSYVPKNQVLTFEGSRFAPLFVEKLSLEREGAYEVRNSGGLVEACEK